MRWKKRLSDKEEAMLATLLEQTEGWVAKHFNKRISFPITRWLMGTSITPNQITTVNLMLGIVAAWGVASVSWGWRVVGACLMQLSSILDGCDGEVARLKSMQSKTGAWFDTVADDCVNDLFFVALFVGLVRTTGDSIYWVVGWINVVLSAGATAIIYQQLLAKGQGANAKDFQPTWQEKSRTKKSWFDWVRPIMKRDFFIVILLVFILLDQRPIVFWMGVVGTTVTFLLYSVSFVLSLKSKLCQGVGHERGL